MIDIDFVTGKTWNDDALDHSDHDQPGLGSDQYHQIPRPLLLSRCWPWHRLFRPCSLPLHRRLVLQVLEHFSEDVIILTTNKSEKN